MGYAKNKMMENEDLGFKMPKKKNICSNHFYDPAIVDYIELNGKKISCSYCKPKYQSDKAISLEDLMKFLCRGIYFFYDDAANAGLPYESSDEGYHGTYCDSSELIYNVIGLDSDSSEITQEIIDHLQDYFWCKKDSFALDKDEELIYDWKRFADLIKYKVRYSFFKVKRFDSNDHLTISNILLEVARSIDKLNLINIAEKGQVIFRSRQHSSIENLTKIEELGPPPLKYCTFSNRMSPAGISMFYGAFEQLTAESEVIDVKNLREKSIISTGRFILKEDLYLVDLCSLPNLPSIFDEERRGLISTVAFLYRFVDQIAKSVERDGMEHIDYVPTQVLTEYFRFIVPELTQYKIDGIIYPSAKNENGRCCVIFCDSEECKTVFDLPLQNIFRNVIKV